MLIAYGCENGTLTELAGDDRFIQAVWIDLTEPTADEETAVEIVLNLDIPTREELAEIEESSRLYAEEGAVFMTANLVRRAENDRPESLPVTFIVKDNRLITIRYHNPNAFPSFLRRAGKSVEKNIGGWGIFMSLVEQFVDRGADHLERVSAIVDGTSTQVFASRVGAVRRPKKSPNLQRLLQDIGEEGTFNSRMRESLLSIDRMLTFALAHRDRPRTTREIKDFTSRAKVAHRDIRSLIDHSSFLSSKISFLLDAVLGMISIEQNGIIKIFSVASVIFLPPTLVASIYGMNFDFMPELTWKYGYVYALVLMVLSAALPYLYFRQKGWL